MTEEEIQRRLKENAELKEALTQKDQRIKELERLLVSALQRIEGLERRQAKDSHNSSLPPSRDHGTRKPTGQRQKSQRASGGQPGHPGQSLLQVSTPDEVISHRPRCCSTCQRDLLQERGLVIERRQIMDLPQMRVRVQEHQLETVCCPACQQVTRGTFPEEVKAPVQYGCRKKLQASEREGSILSSRKKEQRKDTHQWKRMKP